VRAVNDVKYLGKAWKKLPTKRWRCCTAVVFLLILKVSLKNIQDYIYVSKGPLLVMFQRRAQKTAAAVWQS